MSSQASEFRNGRSAYLDSLVNPRTLADIPDGVIMPHVNRQETVTYNIPVGASGRGMFVIFPNHPSSLIGVHYQWNSGASKWDTPTYITTAQDLTKTFDKCRKSAQLITIKSTTLPSGIYNMNGTINAVTYQGTLSEIDDFGYNSILSITNSVNDKVGNISVTDGVGIILIPQEFNAPYVRMGDAAPEALVASAIGAGQYGGCLVQSSTSDTVYTWDMRLDTASVPVAVTASNQTILQQIFNMDGNNAAMFDGLGTFSGNFTNTSGVNNVTVRLNVTAELLSLGGDTLATYSGTSQDLTLPPSVSNLATSMQVALKRFTGSAATDLTAVTSYPVFASVRLTLNLAASAASVNLVTFNSATLIGTTRIFNGSYPGVQSPITLVQYDGCNAGAIMTVSGISNFQLVPNPALLRNMPVQYADYDDAEADYVRAALKNRESYGLTSVFSLQRYAEMKSKTEAISRFGDTEIAESFSMSSILGTVAKMAGRALPLVSSFLSGTRKKKRTRPPPMVYAQPQDNALSEGLYESYGPAALPPPPPPRRTRFPPLQLTSSRSGYDDQFYDSASGSAILPAAFSMDDVTARQLQRLANTRIPGRASASVGAVPPDEIEDITTSASGRLRIARNSSGNGLLNCKEAGVRAVLFPTILVDSSSPTLFAGGALYAVVDRVIDGYFHPGSAVKTRDGYSVFGLQLPGEPYSPNTPRVNTSLVRVNSVQGDILELIPNPPVVSGHSSQFALAVMQGLRLPGVFPYVVTGDVVPFSSKGRVNLKVLPNMMFRVKNAFVQGMGLKLIGNDPSSSPMVRTVVQALRLGENNDSSYLKSKYYKVEPLDFPVLACSMDDKGAAGAKALNFLERFANASSSMQQAANEAATRYENAMVRASADFQAWPEVQAAGEAMRALIEKLVSVDAEEADRQAKRTEANKYLVHHLGETSPEAYGHLVQAMEGQTDEGLRALYWLLCLQRGGVLADMAAIGFDINGEPDIVSFANSRLLTGDLQGLRRAFAGEGTMAAPAAQSSQASKKRKRTEQDLEDEQFAIQKEKLDRKVAAAKLSYPWITPQWYIENGNSGPSSSQAAYARKTGNVPEASKDYTEELSRVTGVQPRAFADKIAKQVKNLISPKLSADQQAQYRQVLTARATEYVTKHGELPPGGTLSGWLAALKTQNPPPKSGKTQKPAPEPEAQKQQSTARNRSLLERLQKAYVKPSVSDDIDMNIGDDD